MGPENYIVNVVIITIFLQGYTCVYLYKILAHYNNMGELGPLHCLYNILHVRQWKFKERMQFMGVRMQSVTKTIKMYVGVDFYNDTV